MGTSEIHDTAELDALMADLKDDPIAVSPADDALRDLDVDMAALEVEAEFDEKGYVDTVASSPSAKVIEIPNSVSLKLEEKSNLKQVSKKEEDELWDFDDCLKEIESQNEALENDIKGLDY